MKLNLIYFIICFIFFLSCSKEPTSTSEKSVDIDILNYADIAISKGNQKIVNAVASKLLKDEHNIYLKAEYDVDESLKLRSK